MEDPCKPWYDDVAQDYIFCKHIENIKNQGIVLGSCDGQERHFCPSLNLDRKDMAIWTVLGIDRRPGESFWGIFNDVTENNETSKLIEKGYIIANYDGYSSSPPLYQPTYPVKRSHMAKFIVNSWDL